MKWASRSRPYGRVYWNGKSYTLSALDSSRPYGRVYWNVELIILFIIFLRSRPYGRVYWNDIDFKDLVNQYNVSPVWASVLKWLWWSYNLIESTVSPVWASVLKYRNFFALIDFCPSRPYGRVYWNGIFLAHTYIISCLARMGECIEI